MIHVRHRLFFLAQVDAALAEAAYVPDWKRRPLDHHAKYPGTFRQLRTFFLQGCMRPLGGRTLDDRNLVLLGPTIHAPAEAASQAHQMGVVQVVIGPIQSSPPGAKPARGAAHGEVAFNTTRSTQS